MSERQIKIDYTNHRGERRIRTIEPLGSMKFMANRWHEQPQWLFDAIDIESGFVKTFAIAGIHGSDDDARTTDLLKSNNELLERARAAEALNAELSKEIEQLKASKLSGKSPTMIITDDVDDDGVEA